MHTTNDKYKMNASSFNNKIGNFINYIFNYIYPDKTIQNTSKNIITITIDNENKKYIFKKNEIIEYFDILINLLKNKNETRSLKDILSEIKIKKEKMEKSEEESIVFNKINNDQINGVYKIEAVEKVNYGNQFNIKLTQ